MSLQLLMVHAVNIDVKTENKTATGANVPSWSRQATNTACRVSDPTPDEAVVMYGKFDAQRQKAVYFTSDPAVSVLHRIVWNSQTFQVHSVRNMGGNINRVWRVDCVDKAGA